MKEYLPTGSTPCPELDKLNPHLDICRKTKLYKSWKTAARKALKL